MAYGLSVNQTEKLTKQLSEHLGIAEDEISEAMNAITRSELFRVATNRREVIPDNVVQIRQDEEIDNGLYQNCAT